MYEIWIPPPPLQPADLLTWFRDTKDRTRHSQEQIAAIFREYGLETASQGSVSRWLAGTKPSGRVVEAMERYCATYGASSPKVSASQRREVVSLDVSIDHLEWQITNEPSLGPTQTALVQSLISRLGNTGSYTDNDLKVVRWLTETLGFRHPFAE